MHKFTLSVPLPDGADAKIMDFGVIIELARARAHELDQVVYIHMDGAGLGCPNRWAVSAKGTITVEDIQRPACHGCGDI